MGVMLLALGGCGKANFDAKSYVESALDAKFHREYEEYAKKIGVSAKEAKEQMETEFNESLKTAMKQAGIPITDDEMAEYLKLEADIRAKVKYEVKKVVKDDKDNYTVDVVITPVTAYKDLQTIYTNKLTAAIQAGATQNQYMGCFLESMRECVTNADEGNPVRVTLHVKGEEKDNQRIYSIDEKEWLNVDLIATGQSKK